jgi:predicted acylesterase/phospholipase RssA
MIKHIVMAGGGTLVLRTLGSLHYLIENHYISYEHIQSVYGTSAGAIMGAFLCMKMDLNILITYFVNRPWEDLFEITPTHIYNLYTKKGIFDRTSMVKLLEPIFKYNEISIEITLEEFFEKSTIEFHAFVIEVASFEIVDISHKTHPHFKLVDVLCMTSSLPIAFEPFSLDGTHYIDAGVILNYPLSYCINNLKKERGELALEDLNEIIGFNTHEKKGELDINDVNMIIYTLYMFKKLIKKHTQKPDDVPYTLNYHSSENIFESMIASISSLEKRQEYVDDGILIAEMHVVKFNLERLSQTPSDSV